MIPSRFQAQQGPYGPLLTAGLYPVPSGAPAPAATPSAVSGGGVAAPQAAAPSTAPQAAPAAQAPAPLSNGSVVQGDGGDNESAPSTPSPDQTFGGLATALGAAASIGFGGPLGGLGMLGALGINSAMGVPSFSMQTALDDLAQTAFGRTADVTAGVEGAPEGTGAAVSSWGLAEGPEGGKAGDAMGGSKGDSSGGDMGAKGDSGYGSAPGDGGVNDGSKGDGAADGGSKGDGGSASGADGSAGSHGGESDGQGEGWMDGGYTGHGDDGMVQRELPAGTVHEGEVVIPADMVKYYGLDMLMGLVNGDVPKNRLAELARGGG